MIAQQMLRMTVFILGFFLISGCTTPSIDAGEDKTVQVNETVHIIATVSNTNGATIYYTWKEGSTVLANTAAFDYTPTTVGDHTLTVTGTDGKNTTESDSMVVTATAVPNKLPTADAGADMSGQINQTVTITGSGTDSDGSIVSYEWKEGASILANSATFDYTPTIAGEHTLTLTVTDDRGDSASDSMLFSATDIPNIAPTANAGADVEITVNEAVVITGSATDSDGSIVAYQWKEGASVLSDTASFNYTPATAGAHTLTLTVTDDDGATDSDTMTVTATEVVVGTDTDGDFIPNDVEIYLGMDQFNADEDNDGVVDGLQLTGAHGDQFFEHQWHIRSTGALSSPDPDSSTVVGNDLNLMDIYHSYMGYNNGNPVTVQVVDTGVDYTHEDLTANMDLTLSRNSITQKMGDPAESADSSHGTRCTGIIAARGLNGKGVRGIAPFAKVAVSNWLSSQGTYAELEEAWTKNDPDGKIILASNSWGVTQAYTYPVPEDLMAFAANNLRIVNGVAQGKLFIKSAGNGREKSHDSGLSYIMSNPYVITVAALKSDNTHASYSSAGSNILVSGYSGNYFHDSATIGTTYLTDRAAPNSDLTYDFEKNCYARLSDGICTVPTWEEDSARSYTYGMNGTSAAAPTVAGSVALVLEACPNLNWRDVKYLIANTAIQVDPTNPTWVSNGAGLHHSVDYGFGLINPSKMIELCQADYKALPAASMTEETFTPEAGSNIPDNDRNGLSYRFTVNSNKTIEWMAVELSSDHTAPAELEIFLTSPEGTTTRLMRGNNSGGDSYSLAQGFRYGSVAFMNESSAGTWSVKVVDTSAANSGQLTDLTFKVFGH